MFFLIYLQKHIPSRMKKSYGLESATHQMNCENAPVACETQIRHSVQFKQIKIILTKCRSLGTFDSFVYVFVYMYTSKGSSSYSHT